eukprot:jgi/Chlat1/8863/Chrsp91S00683
MSPAGVVPSDNEATFLSSHLSHSKRGAIPSSLPLHPSPLLSHCLRRFRLVRCHNSLQFLCALKTMRPFLANTSDDSESESESVGVRIVVVDSVGAFHHVDRAANDSREGVALTMSQIHGVVVRELRWVLARHKPLILASKGVSTHASDSKDVRDVMTPEWQRFVTHRVSLRRSIRTSCSGEYSGDVGHDAPHKEPVFTLCWEEGPHSLTEEFVVRTSGIKWLRSGT